MSKEYIEAFEIVYNNFDYLISDVGIENDDVNICLKTIKEQLPTIKQALLKAQFLEEEYNNLMEDKDNLESELFKVTAPKHYLKWEDLEFKEET